MRALLLTAVVLLAPAPALAFECTVAKETPFVTIRWPARHVTIAIQSPGSRTVTATQTLDAVKRSLEAWETPRCTDITFEMKGVITPDVPISQQSRVIFVDAGWDHDPDAVALTTMAYNRTTGLISHGRIEVNEEGYSFADARGGCGRPDDYDLAAVLTHEVGHFIGLAHTGGASLLLEGPDAPTMSPVVSKCDVAFRTLELDDLDGLCFVYPRNEPARVCQQLPEQEQPYVTSRPFGCDASGAAAKGDFVLLSIALLALRLRARHNPATSPCLGTRSRSRSPRSP